MGRSEVGERRERRRGRSRGRRGRDHDGPREPREQLPPPDPARRNFLVLAHRAVTSPRFKLQDLPGTAGRLDVLCRCVTAGLCLSNGLRRDTQLWFILQGPPGPDVTLRFDGARARYLNPDERSTAALIRHALIKLQEEEARAARRQDNTQNETAKVKVKPDGNQESEAAPMASVRGDDQAFSPPVELERTPGVYISRAGLEMALRRLKEAGSRFILMEESGAPLGPFLEELNLQFTPPVSEPTEERTPAPVADLTPRLTFVLGDDRDPTGEELELMEAQGAKKVGLGPTSLLSSHCIVSIHRELDRLAREVARG